MASTPVGPQLPRPNPVRVGLRRLNANVEKPYPPAGDAKEWWDRLKAAMGTASSDFVSQTLYQLQTAARLPCDGISAIAVNAALSMIESAKPRDEVEAALIIQMACTHTAAMAVLSRIGGAHGGDRHVAMMAAATSKILRAFAIQVETLRRLRAGGSQYMRIEHVHIEPNAQAMILATSIHATGGRMNDLLHCMSQRAAQDLELRLGGLCWTKRVEHRDFLLREVEQTGTDVAALPNQAIHVLSEFRSNSDSIEEPH